MGWNSIIENGMQVDTPHGRGTVKRHNADRNQAQVEVDGQLFEVSGEELTPVQGDQKGDQEFKKGDRIQRKDNPDSTAVIEDETSSTVRIKWDANGKRKLITKRNLKDGFEKQGTKHQSADKQEDKQKQPQEQEQDVKQTGDNLYGLLQLQKHLEQKIDNSIDGELAELKEQVKANQTLEIKIGDKTSKVEGLKHNQLEQLITYASLRLNPLLVGMAGTGKTHAGEQTADALGLKFYSMSVGAQTSKSDIMGYQSASGDYVRTHFRDAYEHGGVFLMDEIDAGNSNVLIQINSALSNELCAFPDKMVKAHEDFVFIASANTFGNGANRQYVGRNQLDAATLDRFAIIEWKIDDELERQLTTGLNGKAWYMAVRASRDYVADKNIRALISPRATLKGCKLLDTGADLDEVIHATMLGSVPEDKKIDVQDVAVQVFNKFASEVKSELPREVNVEVGELIQ